MAVTHPTPSVREGIADNVCGQLNGGSLRFFDNTFVTEVANCALSATAFAAAANGDALANPITPDTNTVAGTVAKARLIASDNTTVIVECDVAVSGSDIDLSSLAIAAGDTIAVDSLTYSAPA